MTRERVEWLHQLGKPGASSVEGLVLVYGLSPRSETTPEVVEAVEKARYYGAFAVFFRADTMG